MAKDGIELLRTRTYWPKRKEVVSPTRSFEDVNVDYAVGVVASMKIFGNSQTYPEKLPISAAFGFELDYCAHITVYNHVFESLCNVDVELAKAAAESDDAPDSANQGKPHAGKTD